MKRQPFFISCMIPWVLGMQMLCADVPADKPAFDIPDLVIKAPDRSKLDVLTREDGSALESIEHHKDVPPAQKINTDFLMSENKDIPSEEIPTGKYRVNEFTLSAGNIDTLSYEFLHGQNIDAQNYLFRLSRLQESDYLPHTTRSGDALSLDYGWRLSPGERISFSANLTRQSDEIPSPDGKSRGVDTITAFPMKLVYTRALSLQDNLRADAMIQQWETHLPNQTDSLFRFGLGLGYTNASPQNITYTGEIKLNNAVSLLSAGLRYEPDDTQRIFGKTSISLYSSFLPYVTNESFLAPQVELEYRFSSKELIRFGYLPKMQELDYPELLGSVRGLQLNDQLVPAVDLSRWLIGWEQTWSDQLRWNTVLTVARTKHVLAQSDMDQNGFLSPVNAGWADQVSWTTQADLVLDKEWTASLRYDYANTRLDSGIQLPLESQHKIRSTFKFESPALGREAECVLVYVGERIDVIDPTRTLSSFLQINVAGSQMIQSGMKFQMTIKNLLNTQIFSRGDFADPGLRWTMGLNIIL